MSHKPRATAERGAGEATPESEAAGSRVVKHNRRFPPPAAPGGPDDSTGDGSAEVEELRQRLAQAEKLANIGRFAAGIVHELNNPLTSIIASASHLSRVVEQRPPDELTQHELSGLRRIDEAAKRILEFSRELVSYARPAAPAPSAVSLPQVLDQALLFCEHVFTQRKIRVKRNLSGPLPSVVGHKNQLTQVFINLLTNAAQASPVRSGCVDVNARPPADGSTTVLIQVADNGQGIGVADLDKVFDPFFTTKRDGQGSGLGLAIAHDIVERHGGKLEVQSTVGRGTVFSVVLPAG